MLANRHPWKNFCKPDVVSMDFLWYPGFHNYGISLLLSSIEHCFYLCGGADIKIKDFMQADRGKKTATKKTG